MGDLHPGGVSATLTILHWLTERDIGRVLEVGAGIGNSAARMVSLGWDVTAIEPDPILFASLKKRPGITARQETLLEHRTDVPYDAIIAESVLFQMNLPQAFAQARTLLRPGGFFAFVEAVWTSKVTAVTSYELHDNTKRLFGMAVGSREPLTWQDWCKQLRECGFETVQTELLPRGSAGRPPTSNWPASVFGILRDPRLALWIVRYRLRKRRARMPGGIQESWLFLGRTADR